MPRTYDPQKKRRKAQAAKPLTPAENATLYLFQIVMLALVLLVWFSLLELVGAVKR